MDSFALKNSQGWFQRGREIRAPKFSHVAIFGNEIDPGIVISLRDELKEALEKIERLEREAAERS